MSASNLLTHDDLTELTGSRSAKKQIEVLVKHGIKFIIRTDGKARTTWSAVNAVLLTKQKNEEQEPNLEFLRRG